MDSDVCVFHIVEHTKTSKPRVSAPTLVLRKYSVNERLCPQERVPSVMVKTSEK